MSDKNPVLHAKTRDIAFKIGQPVRTLDPAELTAIYAHQAQRSTFTRITALINALRQCKSPADLFEFQQDLFRDAYQVDNRRALCARMAKRLRNGRKLPIDAPEAPERGDPHDPGTWEFDGLVHERLFRQFRSVGDGLAWIAVGYSRRAIVTLSRNPSPGPLVKRAGTAHDATTGLAWELGRVQDIWTKRNRFALLHDLTNCLRIADITEFDSEGRSWLHEVKADPKRSEKSQTIRMEEAVGSILGDGPLPGSTGHARLIELTEPYRTNLGQLADLLALAHQHGSRGMKLSQGRAIVGSSPFDLLDRCGANYEKGLQIMESARRGAVRRAGIAAANRHINGRSADQAARSALSVPWAIYPLSPSECAALICDVVIFETIISVDGLTKCLNEEGLDVEVALPDTGGEMQANQDILYVRSSKGSLRLTVHSQSVAPLLFELLEPQTWARGLAELLSKPTLPGEPFLLFAGEGSSWAPTALST